jgi:hypothetical protein
VSTNVNGWIDVTDHGAFGDGVHDDTSAIIGAIALIPTAGNVLYFPPGTYWISAGLSALPSDVMIRGAGSGASTILSTALSSSIVEIDGSSNITVTDIGLQYSGAAISGASAVAITATTLAGSSNIRVTDVMITDAHVAVLVQGSPAGGGATGEGCSDIFCSRVTITSTASQASGFVIAGGSKTANKRLHFTDCAVKLGSETTAYASWNVTNAASVFLENCASYGGSYGVYVNTVNATDAVYSVQMSNCTFESSGINAVNFTTVSAAQTINTVSLTNCLVASAAQQGIATDMVVGTGSIWALSFTNCTIIGNGAEGVALGGVSPFTNAQIVGCNISENCTTLPTGTAGISLANANNVVVSGCNITPALRPPSSGDVQSQLNGVAVAGATCFNIAIEWTPEMFGAQGDGSTDDTAAFVRALSALSVAGGGELCLRAHVTYALNCASLLPLMVPSGVSIVGEGEDFSVLDAGVSTGYVVELTGSGCGLRSLQIQAQPIGTSTATAIKLNATNVTIRETSIVSGQCIEVAGGSNILIRDCNLHTQQIGSSVTAGFGIRTTGACNDLHVKRVTSGAQSNNGRGIWLSAGSDLSFHVFDNEGLDFGLYVDAANGAVTNCRFTDASWDTNTSDSAHFVTSTTHEVYGFQFINSWTSGCQSGVGLNVAPASAPVHDFQFSNHIITRCVLNGVHIQPSATSSVSGMLFGKLQNDGCQPAGILLDASSGGTIDGISITGGYSGNAPNSPPPPNQPLAVSIASTHALGVTNVLVLGFDTSTMTAPTISNPRVSASVWFEACAGFNPIGLVVPPPGVLGTGAIANTTGVDQNVYIATDSVSTVNMIHIAGVLTGLSMGPSSFLQVPVPAGQTIAVNPVGSGVTWTWIGN